MREWSGHCCSSDGGKKTCKFVARLIRFLVIWIREANKNWEEEEENSQHQPPWGHLQQIVAFSSQLHLCLLLQVIAPWKSCSPQFKLPLLTVRTPLLKKIKAMSRADINGKSSMLANSDSCTMSRERERKGGRERERGVNDFNWFAWLPKAQRNEVCI